MLFSIDSDFLFAPQNSLSLLYELKISIEKKNNAAEKKVLDRPRCVKFSHTEMFSVLFLVEQIAIFPLNE